MVSFVNSTFWNETLISNLTEWNNSSAVQGMSFGDFFTKCITMDHLVYKGSVLGYVSQMPYMITNQWYTSTTLSGFAIFMSIFVGICFLMQLCFFILHFFSRQKQTYTNWLNLLFNLSNALLFIILSSIGWSQNAFYLAALHNSIELMFCFVLVKKYIFWIPERYYSILKYVFYLIIFFTTIPHLIIVDFQINAYIKIFGGVFDFLLLLFCTISEIKWLVDWIRIKFFKHQLILPSTSHILLLLNLHSHTLTVAVAFLSCHSFIPHVVFILIGTFSMNTLGVLYFVHQKFYKTISYKYLIAEWKKLNPPPKTDDNWMKKLIRYGLVKHASKEDPSCPPSPKIQKSEVVQPVVSHYILNDSELKEIQIRE